MRCGLACAVTLLTFAPAAAGASPAVSAAATPTVGEAPLIVTFTAGGEAATYHWEFGDGRSADGLTVAHTYAAGRWSATLTARSAEGETATQTIAITSYGLTIEGPARAKYGRRVSFRGTIVPAEPGLAVILRGPRGRLASTRTRADGSYVVTARVKQNGSYFTTTERASSRPIALRVVRVPARLALGSRGPPVRELGARLRSLHFAAPAGNHFDDRMLDAVYAFEKVYGLPRTGVADARFWRALAVSRPPIPRYAHPADHLEVNKGRQVLYVVRNARVVLIVPISTAGVPGTYTPVGRFSIYRKVVGFDPSPLGTLYDPMYFTGGYAIHGNPSVPPYPASHGCVRVPMWVAAQLYRSNPYGATVYVY
jgi:PKD repeat protein